MRSGPFQILVTLEAKKWTFNIQNPDPQETENYIYDLHLHILLKYVIIIFKMKEIKAMITHWVIELLVHKCDVFG